MILTGYTVPGRIQPMATVQGSTACHVRAAGRKGRLGPDLAARSSRGGGPCGHAIARALGALALGHRVQPARGTAWWRGHRGAGGG
jgi:hypothetical protein